MSDGTWVVTVEFTIRPDFAAPFHQRLATQAAESLREAGCSRLDVCVDPADERRVFLYEVYSNKDAFAIHLASPHFKDSTRRRVNVWRPRPSLSGA